MPDEFSAKLINEFGVRRDWVDLRDQNYQPVLSVLRGSVSLDPRLLQDVPETELKQPVFGVRNQGSTGRCVGYALANIVDLQRYLQHLRQFDAFDKGAGELPAFEEDVVSADMLYRMAYFHDRYPDLEEAAAPSVEGIRTLRSAIKGFYHHGVCLDWPDASCSNDPSRWQSTCYFGDSLDKARPFPTVEQAKKAREIGLGAYFRLASVLNHFHAALNEAEAVLATANIHDGWLSAVPHQGGEIEWPPKKGKIGTHAFVLTGYDEQGFHVLNSWGNTWGGYKGQAGIGLWRYADWAQNVVDSWILRLGVHAPTAFGVSIGEKGSKGVAGPAQSGSTPCFELVGHYMHLDDGFHVTTGSYPSFPNGWERTHEYLVSKLKRRKKPAKSGETDYRGILIWLPGSLEGIKPAFASAVQRKNAIKALGLYPYSIFWCNSFVEKSLEVLEIIFDSCKEQAGEDAAHLDSLIEQRVQGVGRAFWRDIEMSARRAVRGTGELPHEPDEFDTPTRVTPGYVASFLANIMKLKAETKCEVHLVAEGAGALVVHELLSIIKDDSAKPDPKSRLFCRHDPAELFDSLHLIHPAIGMPRAKKQLIPLVEEMNGEIVGRRNRFQKNTRTPKVQSFVKDAQPKARIYIPSLELEDAVRFGSYSKSILHLVSRSFEDRKPVPDVADGKELPQFREPRKFLGMAEIANDSAFRARGALYRLNRIEKQVHGRERVSQTDLNQDPTITKDIFRTIQEFRKTK